MDNLTPDNLQQYHTEHHANKAHNPHGAIIYLGRHCHQFLPPIGVKKRHDALNDEHQTERDTEFLPHRFLQKKTGALPRFFGFYPDYTRTTSSCCCSGT